MTRAATQTKTLSIAVDSQQPVLSKGQKTFNTLLKQIDQKRKRLAAWEQATVLYQRKHASELLPLDKSLVDLQVKFAHRLDWASEQKGWTKTERRMLVQFTTELAGTLLAERESDGDRDGAQLKAIYNKHSPTDYDSEVAQATEEMNAVLKGVFGFDLGDEGQDLESPQDLLERVAEKIVDEERQFMAEDERRQEQQAQRQAQRKKSAKQQAKDEKEQLEKQQLSQSIREVYRKLVSALHPDRETDPQERDRKTALMQRVNQAYDKNNLLQLLELQLELEHIDQASLSNLSEERLGHYNKILKEQLVELDQEIAHVVGGFSARFDMQISQSAVPQSLMHDMAHSMACTREAISNMKKTLLTFEAIEQIKRWLKDRRLSRRAAQYADFYD